MAVAPRGLHVVEVILPRRGVGKLGGESSADGQERVAHRLRLEHRLHDRLHQAGDVRRGPYVPPTLQRRVVGKDQVGVLGGFVGKRREAHHERHLRQRFDESGGPRQVEGRVGVREHEQRHPARGHVVHQGQQSGVRARLAARRFVEADGVADVAGNVVQQVDRNRQRGRLPRACRDSAGQGQTRTVARERTGQPLLRSDRHVGQRGDPFRGIRCEETGKPVPLAVGHRAVGQQMARHAERQKGFPAGCDRNPLVRVGAGERHARFDLDEAAVRWGRGAPHAAERLGIVRRRMPRVQKVGAEADEKTRRGEVVGGDRRPVETDAAGLSEGFIAERLVGEQPLGAQRGQPTCGQVVQAVGQPAGEEREPVGRPIVPDLPHPLGEQ